MTNNILVVGGAGYIGSHMVKHLLDNNKNVVVVDNLFTGYKDAIDKRAKFAECHIGNDMMLWDKVFCEYEFDAVMHFASYIQVGESVTNPAKYYQNNISNTLTLLDNMLSADVKNFIFSSSAAIFGEPLYTPMDEEHQKNPINPYGRTKLMMEQILQDYDVAYGMKSVCLRYFNAAGADPGGKLGERHDPETHLIPILLQVASCRREQASIFGTDYPTKDGTCIRDYIHVSDLCDAHLLALENLFQNNKSDQFNLGNGNGFSVAEVVREVQLVTGKILNLNYCDRRNGDPAILVANSTKAKDILKWNPKFNNLSDIIKHAWAFEMKNTTNKVEK